MLVYYGTTFFQTVGIKNEFIITIITNVVNVASTPLSFWAIEHLGRRKLLLWGAALMTVCEFIIAIVGTAQPNSKASNKVLIAFVCIYIFGFATTWGPAAWVIIGEIFPLPIRAKGVALSTASNWFWNCVSAFPSALLCTILLTALQVIAVVTPYIVDKDKGNLGAKVFFVWGTTCFTCFLFAYFFVYETKGLSLEQVDCMLEETRPMTSAKWTPHETYASRLDKVGHARPETEHTEKV